MYLRCSAYLLLGGCLLGTAFAAAPVPPPGAEQKARDEETVKAANLGSDGPALVAFLKKHTVGDVDREHIKKLVGDLGDDSFAVREKASDQLLGLGVSARALLREAAHDPDVEVAVRATRLLEQIEKEGGPAVVCAAVRLVADRKPDGAAEVLLAFAPSAEDQSVVDDIAHALAVVGFRDRKPQAVLTDALTDKSALRRAVAAEALCRGGGPDQRPAVRKMLQDGDAGVRLRTALALFDGHDKEAIPVLINLLVELPREQVWRAEDPLYLAAGEKAPAGSPGADEVGRREYKKQWNQWWQDNGKDLDLAKLEQRQRLQGLNLICLFDGNKGAVGRVQEVDNDGKVKWQIDNLRYPVDAQMIGEDRVLVCEYTGRQVSERNLKGEVQWSKATTALLLTARRLANGNTFIATRNSLQEVDKDGKEVVSIARPNNDLATAVRLRNGDFAVVTNLGQFLRLSPEGKELKSFPVGQVLAVGGGIDVQPNGRVLVPLYSQGKVVEFDAEGKKLWEADVVQPSSVARLPNGNVLVSSRNARAVVEIDRTGKEVWKHATDGLPMKASRR
jgi:hypothetical protein